MIIYGFPVGMIKESALRERLGFGKPEMKALRDRAPEGSWIRDVSKKPEKLWGWLWSDEGVKWIESEIGVKPDAVIDKPTEVEGKVIRSGFLNKRLVEVEIAGVKHMAICKDNKEFKPRMIVNTRFVGGNACVTSATKKHMNSFLKQHG